jgi:hypothetical protein
VPSSSVARPSERMTSDRVLSCRLSSPTGAACRPPAGVERSDSPWMWEDDRGLSRRGSTALHAAVCGVRTRGSRPPARTVAELRGVERMSCAPKQRPRRWKPRRPRDQAIQAEAGRHRRRTEHRRAVHTPRPDLQNAVLVLASEASPSTWASARRVFGPLRVLGRLRVFGLRRWGEALGPWQGLVW